MSKDMEESAALFVMGGKLAEHAKVMLIQGGMDKIVDLLSMAAMAHAFSIAYAISEGGDAEILICESQKLVRKLVESLVEKRRLDS